MPFINSIEYTYGYNSPSIPFVTTNLVVQLMPNTYPGSGTTWDNPINGTDATLINTPTFVPGTGFTFSGSTSTPQYGSLSSVSGVTDFTSSQNYTIEVWCYINSTQADLRTGDNDILEKWNRNNEGRYPYVCRYLNESQTITFAVYNGSSNPTTTMPANTNRWAQYVGVFNHSSALLSIYKNGVFANSTPLGAVAGTNITNTSPLYLAQRGGSDGSNQNLLAGRIGILRIYSSALSASDVTQNFNANRRMYGV